MVHQPPSVDVNSILSSPHAKTSISQISFPHPSLYNLHTLAHSYTSTSSLYPKSPWGSHRSLVPKSHISISHTRLPFTFLMLIHTWKGKRLSKVTIREGEGGMFQENSIETCILFRVKQITSPGWMHETSARTWCTGKTQRDRVEREVGGGIGMGNRCISKADSCQCMTKSTTIL